MLNSVTGTAAIRPGVPRFPAVFPRAGVGVSFKPEHLPQILASRDLRLFFEVHAENYMGAGGRPHQGLRSLRREHSLSVHGVGMSLGAPGRLDREHLQRFCKVVDLYEPTFISEHLAWSTHEGTYFSDLLPLPYTHEVLARVVDHVDEMQVAVGRQILLENPATYVSFKQSTLSEAEFIGEVVKRSGCGLLLDINNVCVSSFNHGYGAQEYLDELPLGRVGELHLAGHVERGEGAELLLLDSHDCPVARTVWQLYEQVVSIIGPVPTLIEWDSDIPSWEILAQQAETARSIQDRPYARAI
jgi:uncharacterized protein (UPF0276 family)